LAENGKLCGVMNCIETRVAGDAAERCLKQICWEI